MSGVKSKRKNLSLPGVAGITAQDVIDLDDGRTNLQILAARVGVSSPAVFKAIALLRAEGTTTMTTSSSPPAPTAVAISVPHPGPGAPPPPPGSTCKHFSPSGRELIFDPVAGEWVEKQEPGIFEVSRQSYAYETGARLLSAANKELLRGNLTIIELKNLSTIAISGEELMKSADQNQ